MEKIRVGISGYGNIGKGVEQAIARNSDMRLVSIVTRRDPSDIHPITEGTIVLAEHDLEKLCGKLDVMILCGGSATDLPQQGPRYAQLFNTLDSFDTHAAIPNYYAEVDAAAKMGGNLALISAGWDPGLFSIIRTYGQAILPQGESYTFWGKGVSQGHSDAIRRIPGVKNAVQYTVPVDSAVMSVRAGDNPKLTARQKHLRQCFVVAEDGADTKAIEIAIKGMPNYFADYETSVTFITEAEMKAKHSAMPHGGFVFRTGETGQHNLRHVMEFSLKLESNPEFTGSVLTAYARAIYRMSHHGRSGCITVLDVPPAALSPKTPEELRRELL